MSVLLRRLADNKVIISTQNYNSHERFSQKLALITGAYFHLDGGYLAQ